MDKTILEWTSKVQYRKGTPYLSLIKHLSNQITLQRGNDVNCKLVLDGVIKWGGRVAKTYGLSLLCLVVDGPFEKGKELYSFRAVIMKEGIFSYKTELLVPNVTLFVWGENMKKANFFLHVNEILD